MAESRTRSVFTRERSMSVDIARSDDSVFVAMVNGHGGTWEVIAEAGSPRRVKLARGQDLSKGKIYGAKWNEKSHRFEVPYGTPPEALDALGSVAYAYHRWCDRTSSLSSRRVRRSNPRKKPAKRKASAKKPTKKPAKKSRKKPSKKHVSKPIARRHAPTEKRGLRGLRLYHIGGTKFWEIALSGLNGKSFTVTWGKVGTRGQSQTKTFGTAGDAHKAYEKILDQKLKRGYEI